MSLYNSSGTNITDQLVITDTTDQIVFGNTTLTTFDVDCTSERVLTVPASASDETFVFVSEIIPILTDISTLQTDVSAITIELDGITLQSLYEKVLVAPHIEGDFFVYKSPTVGVLNGFIVLNNLDDICIALLESGNILCNTLILPSGTLTSTAPELNYLHLTTPGTSLASKALVTDASNNLIGLNNFKATTLQAYYLDLYNSVYKSTILSQATGADDVIILPNNQLSAASGWILKLITPATGETAWSAISLTSLGTFSSAQLATSLTDETGTGVVVFSTSPTLVSPNLGTPLTLIGTNITGTSANFTAKTCTTIPSLSGNVTSSGNAVTVNNGAVIGKVLTGFTSGAGVISSTDTILQAIQKLNGNDATNANLTGMVTSSGNDTTVVTNANLTGMVTSVGNASTVVTNANLTGMVTSVGNATTVVTNANLTGECTSSGNVTTLTNSAVIGKVLTGYVSGAGTVAATDTILQAIQKLNANNAVNANLTGMVTSVGNASTVVTNANLTGECTSSGNATILNNASVIGKVLTGYTSGAGTVAATDTILQAIQKLNGNIVATTIQTSLTLYNPSIIDNQLLNIHNSANSLNAGISSLGIISCYDLDPLVPSSTFIQYTLIVALGATTITSRSVNYTSSIELSVSDYIINLNTSDSYVNVVFSYSQSTRLTSITFTQTAFSLSQGYTIAVTIWKQNVTTYSPGSAGPPLIGFATNSVIAAPVGSYVQTGTTAMTPSTYASHNTKYDCIIRPNKTGSSIPILNVTSFSLGGTLITSTASQLNNLVPINSPAFTGSPATPTAVTSDNSLQIANTSYVKSNLANYAPLVSAVLTGVPQAPSALPSDNSFQIANTSYVKSNLATYALLSSPIFTGIPQAPSALPSDNSFQIANTSYVKSNLANYALTSSLVVYAQLSSPNFTSVPTAPTASTATNTTQIATTAYVQANLTSYAPLASPTLTGVLTVPQITNTTNMTSPQVNIGPVGNTGSQMAWDRINYYTSIYYVLNGVSVGVKLSNGTTAWAAQSDIRTKKNIKQITPALDKICQLNPVTFDYKSDKSDASTRVGFIAQEVNTVIPQAVILDPNDNMYSIMNTELIPFLVKAIQELRAEVAALKSK